MVFALSCFACHFAIRFQLRIGQFLLDASKLDMALTQKYDRELLYLEQVSKYSIMRTRIGATM